MIGWISGYHMMSKNMSLQIAHSSSILGDCMWLPVKNCSVIWLPVYQSGLSREWDQKMEAIVLYPQV
jgi:hypothetical protein